eukprot:3933205-Rhodomonas_salina.5
MALTTRSSPSISSSSASSPSSPSLTDRCAGKGESRVPEGYDHPPRRAACLRVACAVSALQSGVLLGLSGWACGQSLRDSPKQNPPTLLTKSCPVLNASSLAWVWGAWLGCVARGSGVS